MFLRMQENLKFFNNNIKKFLKIDGIEPSTYQNISDCSTSELYL